MIKKLGAEIACLALITAIFGGVIFAGFYLSDNYQGLAASPLSRFSSFEELKNFVESGQQNYNTYERNALALSPLRLSPTFSASNTEQKGSFASTPDYSATNIQVEGVDEIDFVKTDGEYLYVVSDNDVFIVKAYPA